MMEGRRSGGGISGYPTTESGAPASSPAQMQSGPQLVSQLVAAAEQVHTSRRAAHVPLGKTHAPPFSQHPDLMVEDGAYGGIASI